jgi:hypothetical protein
LQLIAWMNFMEAEEKQVVVQISGGLGNQFFQYAMGRRLALANGVPLVLDHRSCFPRDRFRRKFTLDKFNIQCGFVAEGDSYASWAGRVRRRIDRWRNRGRPLERRYYVEEEVPQVFQPELLACRVRQRMFFAGYWQHEEYFRDMSATVRRDLTLKAAPDPRSVELAAKIRAVNAVCLHVRRLYALPNEANARPRAEDEKLLVDPTYYQRALELVVGSVPNPHIFVFADYPDWAREHIRTPWPLEFVTHNGAERDYEDFWLMSQCRHFVIANSTFSWWAAWLAESAGKVVVAPRMALGRMLQSVPREWQSL